MTWLLLRKPNIPWLFALQSVVAGSQTIKKLSSVGTIARITFMYIAIYVYTLDRFL